MTSLFTLLLPFIGLLFSALPVDKPRPFTIVAAGDFAAERHKVTVVCFNKYYNQEMYPVAFRKDYKLDEMDDKEFMAIELFMGDTPGKGHQLILESVEETATQIEIRYTFKLNAIIDSTITTRPFLIATTPKDKKKDIVFIANEVAGKKGIDMYIKN